MTQRERLRLLLVWYNTVEARRQWVMSGRTFRLGPDGEVRRGVMYHVRTHDDGDDIGSWLRYIRSCMERLPLDRLAALMDGGYDTRGLRLGNGGWSLRLGSASAESMWATDAYNTLYREAPRLLNSPAERLTVRRERGVMLTAAWQLRFVRDIAEEYDVYLGMTGLRMFLAEDGCLMLCARHGLFAWRNWAELPDWAPSPEDMDAYTCRVIGGPLTRGLKDMIERQRNKEGRCG